MRFDNIIKPYEKVILKIKPKPAKIFKYAIKNASISGLILLLTSAYFLFTDEANIFYFIASVVALSFLLIIPSTYFSTKKGEYIITDLCIYIIYPKRNVFVLPMKNIKIYKEKKISLKKPKFATINVNAPDKIVLRKIKFSPLMNFIIQISPNSMIGVEDPENVCNIIRKQSDNFKKNNEIY